jgi:hypothetical protein
MFKINLLCSLSIMFLAGCSGKFSDELERAEFTVARLDTARYQVSIETPKDTSVSVIRTSKWTSESTLIAENKSGFIFDTSPTTGELYTYKVGNHRNNEFHESYSVDVYIPLEVISSEMRAIPEHYYEFSKTVEGLPKLEVVTMILDKGFPFALNKSLGEISIRKIISKDGILESHSFESVAKYSSDGHTVGPFNLKIHSGEGDIQIILRGQKGGQPPPPAPLGEEGRGIKGPKGSDGDEDYVYNYQMDETVISCRKEIGIGGTGGKGKTGLSGLNGMDGAGTGNLFLEVAPGSNISYVIDRVQGDGGEGGVGGQGGPGGPPGEPGGLNRHQSTTGDPDKAVRKTLRSVKDRECKTPPPGQYGPEGDLGPSGNKGKPGAIDKICIKNHASNTWSCEK